MRLRINYHMHVWVLLAMTGLILSSCRTESVPARWEPTGTFGIDVSHYSGRINWNKVQQTHHPIQFVFVRATMGVDGLDHQYYRNWEGAQKAGYIRGAYHFYRPEENSTEQFENFKLHVQLESGDLPIVLDIEKESPYGRDNLRQGLRNWLELAEAHYGIKPILYTGLNFYEHVLKGHFDDYPLWIAAYSRRPNGVKWAFHQISEEVRVKGIPHLVDGNDFNGSLAGLRAMTYDYVAPMEEEITMNE